ncbi:MAG: UDP-N-acetylmuramoyl-tripeptide--D-alanyl-D-alanine ligase [Deltaproteobacteria bacterium]|nr:UDP-N-acetylmuramoyl-tripeptide--D-alanyl-D-alanine ligase [Deltaproteobacteria bacterium]
MGWTGQEIATATGAAAGVDAAAAACRAVSTDTRRLPAGAHSVAPRGAPHDGHAFAAAALAGGATAVLVDHLPPGVAPRRAFVVPDTLRALGDLAAFTRRRWGGPLAAITGSNGKTTTKEMLAAIGETATPGRVLKTHGNENNLVGVPLTLFRLAGAEALAVIEMGMNAFGEIARLTEIATPDVGCITNVGPAHLEGVGDLAGVARAKGELFAGLSPHAVIAVNMDDPLVVGAAAGYAGRRVEFGHGRTVRAEAIDDRGADGVGFRLAIGAARAPVMLRAAGAHNVQNALAAAAVAHALGIGLDAIVAGLAAAEPPKMRMQVVRLANGVTLINDAYNANPASTNAALDAVARAAGAAGRAIAVLGEMRELGSTSAALHAAVGAHAAAAGVAWLIAVGPQADAIAAGARAAGGLAVDECPDAAAAAALIAERWQAGDAILVKGSRGADDEPGVRRYGARMAEVVARLSERGGAS